MDFKNIQRKHWINGLVILLFILSLLYFVPSQMAKRKENDNEFQKRVEQIRENSAQTVVKAPAAPDERYISGRILTEQFICRAESSCFIVYDHETKENITVEIGIYDEEGKNILNAEVFGKCKNFHKGICHINFINDLTLVREEELINDLGLEI